jgi:hypothetical protein
VVGVRIHRRATQVHVSLTIAHSAAHSALAAGNWPRELSVLHRWPPFTQFIIMLRQINPWEYYCSFAAPVFCTLWRFICCSRAKLPGYLFLRRKRAGSARTLSRSPTKVCLLLQVIYEFGHDLLGSAIRLKNPSYKGSKAISSLK